MDKVTACINDLLDRDISRDVFKLTNDFVVLDATDLKIMFKSYPFINPGDELPESEMIFVRAQATVLAAAYAGLTAN